MAAKKGNKYAEGNKGQDKKYTSPELMQKGIDKYFHDCDNNEQLYFDKKSLQTIAVKMPKPYTIEGLALSLGFTETDSLLNYEKKEGYEEFFGTVKKARTRIASQKLENALLGIYNAQVAIFDLKNNHGYSDKQQIETKDTTPRSRPSIKKKVTVIKRVVE